MTPPASASVEPIAPLAPATRISRGRDLIASRVSIVVSIFDHQKTVPSPHPPHTRQVAA
jgi:hypothetical protein